MKKIYIYFFLVITAFASSQEKAEVTKNIFKLNVLMPGFTYESALSSKTTFVIDANVSFGYVQNTNEKKFLLSPYIRGQYRYYYNLERRVERGKDIFNNSGGFFAFSSSYYLEPLNSSDNKYISQNDNLTIGAVWGFQKTYKNKINLTANTGFGYNFSKELKNDIVPIINITFAYVLGK